MLVFAFAAILGAFLEEYRRHNKFLIDKLVAIQILSEILWYAPNIDEEVLEKLSIGIDRLTDSVHYYKPPTDLEPARLPHTLSRHIERLIYSFQPDRSGAMRVFGVRLGELLAGVLLGIFAGMVIGTPLIIIPWIVERIVDNFLLPSLLVYGASIGVICGSIIYYTTNLPQKAEAEETIGYGRLLLDQLKDRNASNQGF